MNTKEWYFGDANSDNYDERSDEDFNPCEDQVPMDTSASSESETEEENEQEIEENGEASNDVNDENTIIENHVQQNNNHRISKKNGDTKISQRTRSRLRAVRAENNGVNRSINDGDEVYSNGINGSLDEDSANDVNGGGDYEHDIHSPNGDIMNGSSGSTNGINGNGSRLSQSRRVPLSPGQDRFSNPRQNNQYFPYFPQEHKLKRLDVPFSIFSGEFNSYHEDLESEFKDLEIKERRLNSKKSEKASQASEAKKLSEEKKVELKKIMDRNKDLRDQVEDLHGVLMDVLTDLVQSDDDDASQLNPLTIGPLILELARRLASQKL
ncbi:6994_t:CDS:2 [Diversispora eburnea]|uniref:6994_t:CDS:1 n=1 Tax=Diversispora eburnea TaxID=1213867 RepID=A0A9N8V0H5_9GLOM|nr:6994_t:CDS:2 [Diversispora eburnea]